MNWQYQFLTINSKGKQIRLYWISICLYHWNSLYTLDANNENVMMTQTININELNKLTMLGTWAIYAWPTLRWYDIQKRV